MARCCPYGGEDRGEAVDERASGFDGATASVGSLRGRKVFRVIEFRRFAFEPLVENGRVARQGEFAKDGALLAGRTLAAVLIAARVRDPAYVDARCFERRHLVDAEGDARRARPKEDDVKDRSLVFAADVGEAFEEGAEFARLRGDGEGVRRQVDEGLRLRRRCRHRGRPGRDGTRDAGRGRHGRGAAGETRELGRARTEAAKPEPKRDAPDKPGEKNERRLPALQSADQRIVGMTNSEPVLPASGQRAVTVLMCV